MDGVRAKYVSSAELKYDLIVGNRISKVRVCVGERDKEGIKGRAL